MKKVNIENMVLEMVGKVVKLEVKKNENAWPPICTGIVHQPKRPKKVERNMAKDIIN